MEIKTGGNLENLKINYETDIKTCITDCPFRVLPNGKRPKVGSALCNQCQSFISSIPKSKIVYCKKVAEAILENS